MPLNHHTVEYAGNWIAAHGPSFRRLSFEALGHKYVTFAAAASEVAAVPSAAAVVGPAASVARDADQALQAAGSSVDAVTKVLLEYPILGATSIMDLALKHSGFQPTMPDSPNNYQNYLQYTNDVVTAPFFHLQYSDVKDLHEESENWDKLINSIVDLFEGVVEKDHTRIVSGLKQLAHAATSATEKIQTLNTFSQQVLRMDNKEIQVALYSSRISMKASGGKCHPDRSVTDYKVNRAILTFYEELWPQCARMVAETKVIAVKDWVSAMSSKQTHLAHA